MNEILGNLATTWDTSKATGDETNINITCTKLIQTIAANEFLSPALEHTDTSLFQTASPNTTQKQTIMDAILDELTKKYNLEAGLETMFRITNYYAMKTMQDQTFSQIEPHEILKRIIRKNDAKLVFTNSQAWPVFANTLCPHPRALSTYTTIVEWIENEEVDILSRFPMDEIYADERDNKGNIINRLKFLHGYELPPDTSNWWGGGRKEEVNNMDEESSDDDKNETSRRREHVKLIQTCAIESTNRCCPNRYGTDQRRK